MINFELLYVLLFTRNCFENYNDQYRFAICSFDFLMKSQILIDNKFHDFVIKSIILSILLNFQRISTFRL